MTFTESDLTTDISRKELDGIAKKLVEDGDPEPIATTISEQSRKVADYTRRYVLDEERQRRLIRALVLFELTSRVGSIPDKRQTKYDAAMKELEGIRDGKFPDLQLVSPVPSDISPARGAWGGKKRFRGTHG